MIEHTSKPVALVVALVVADLLSACTSYDRLLDQSTLTTPTSTEQESRTATVLQPNERQSNGQQTDSAMPKRVVGQSKHVPQPTGAAAYLLEQSKRLVAQGHLNASAHSIEQAMRIEPGNPWLSLALAQVRLQQKDATQAQLLAQRALSRAGQDIDLNRQSWHVIADARQVIGDFDGAQKASQRAASW